MSKNIRSIRQIKGPKTIILSPKAQLALQYYGTDFAELQRFAALRDLYLRKRDTDSINRISTAEMERIVKNGLTLATRGRFQA